MILFLLSLQGLVNNTGIDWFMPWPPQALHAVAKSFLGKLLPLWKLLDVLLKKLAMVLMDLGPVDWLTVDTLGQGRALYC